MALSALVPDWYRSFDDLCASEQEGTHFKVICSWRDSPVTIVAPHGGSIEPGTSLIAAAIAGDSFNLYCFEGLLPREEPHARLHITSHRFDEPRCLGVVARSDHVVTVHGMRELTERTLIGGLDETLKQALQDRLRSAGYDAEPIEAGRYSARNAANICNKGRRGRGVQLELGRDLRVRLRTDSVELARFAVAIQAALTAVAAG